MSSRRVIVLLIIAMAGYALLALVYPAAAPVTKLDIKINRDQAIAIARQHVISLYPEAVSWPSSVETSVSETSWEYLRRNPRPELSRLISPIKVTVNFPVPGTPRSVEVTLGTEGQLEGIKESTSGDVSAAPVTAAKSQEEQQSLAAASLQKIANGDWSNFAFKSSTASGTASRTFTWERAVQGEDRVKLRANATVENGTVTQASITPDFSPGFTSPLRKGANILGFADLLFLLFLFVSLLIALIVYFRHVINQEVRHTSTILVLFIALIVILTGMVAGPFFEDLYSGLAFQPALSRYYLGAILTVVLTTLMALVCSLPFFLLWGAGYPESQGRIPNPLSTLELFVRGKIFTRNVASSLLTGISLGWFLPFLSALFARIGFGTNARLAFESTLAGLLYSRAPLLTLPFESTVTRIYVAFALFAFLIPFALRRLRNANLVHAIAIVGGTLCILGSDEFYSGIVAVILTSLLTLIFLDRLTLSAGLLASLAALLSGNFAEKLSVLSAVSVASVQRHAWAGWVVLGLILFAVAFLALRGKILNDLQAQAPWFGEDHSGNREERQRLKAQFQVAQKAQQQMLPSTPPTIAGIEIAADCKPAREVGGDLFDFLSFANGRIGIVVADVSGKGVPASLYMTLTKGLLASVAETTADPGEILREVNHHLYLACQRKMFVTLLLGVLDPELKTFSYARAGHNPPVWRRAIDGETTLLKAHGIGLGLNSGDIFDRSLQIGEVKLGAHDLLILYSDGISEAMNDLREEYGEGRLQSIAARSDGLNAEQVKELILNDVKSFLGRTPPQDDQTLVVVRIR